MAQYTDPAVMQLGDFLNARVKLQYGALSHIITARILDIYPSSAELQKLVDNPHLLDNLAAQVASEVMPGSTGINNGAVANPVIDGGHGGILPFLPRTNSWSELLLYQRA